MRGRAVRGTGRATVRGTVRAALLGAALLAPLPAQSQTAPQTAPQTLSQGDAPAPLGARYATPSTRYGHGAVPEWQALDLTEGAGPDARHWRIPLPAPLVFEDIAPLLADLDGDGTPEIITIEARTGQGARVAIRDATGQRRAASAYLGTNHRWIAPWGAADLDGDGQVELAVMQTPHLAPGLRLFQLRGDVLHELAAPGLHLPEGIAAITIHRFGEARLRGGLRHCAGAPPELLAEDRAGRQLLAGRLTPDGLRFRSLGPTSVAALRRALACG